MTREEAVNKFYMTFQGASIGAKPGSYNWVPALISSLEAIGALKLDAPEALTPLEALSRSISITMDSGPLTAARVNLHLESNGYKIVPK